MKLRRGFWCLHCEHAWHWVVGGPREGLESCPDETCDGGFGDFFPIQGQFEHGEAVRIDSDRFSELRTAADPFAD